MFKFIIFCFMLSMMPSIAHADTFEDGVTAFNASEYQKALSIWLPLAEQDNINAQLNIAQIYLKGLGVTKDTSMALLWLNKAVKLGSTDAEFELGEIYANGYGITTNFELSVNWYRKAAEKGHAKAQYQLGVSYFKGEGVDMDYLTSYAWMDLAAKQGFKTSSSYRDMIASVLKPVELEKAKQLADQLLEKYRKQ